MPDEDETNYDDQTPTREHQVTLSAQERAELAVDEAKRRLMAAEAERAPLKDAQVVRDFLERNPDVKKLFDMIIAANKKGRF